MSNKKILGRFTSMKEVWAAYPDGGVADDTVVVGNSLYYWNTGTANWETSKDKTTTGWDSLNIDGDLLIENDLHVGGTLHADKLKSSFKGLFNTVEQLQQAFPKPDVGDYADVGYDNPQRYVCELGGQWKNSGQPGGTPPVVLPEFIELQKAVGSAGDSPDYDGSVFARIAQNAKVISNQGSDINDLLTNVGDVDSEAQKDGDLFGRAKYLQENLGEKTDTASKDGSAFARIAQNSEDIKALQDEHAEYNADLITALKVGSSVTNAFTVNGEYRLPVSGDTLSSATMNGIIVSSSSFQTKGIFAYQIGTDITTVSFNKQTKVVTAISVSVIGSPEDAADKDGSVYSKIANNKLLINRLKVYPANTFDVVNEEKVYQSISFIRIYADEFIKLYPIILTNNDETYGTRMAFAYYDAGAVKREFYIIDTELLDGGLHRYDFNLTPISKKITIEIQFVPNSFDEGVVYSNTKPVNYIVINNFDVSTRLINEELEAHSTCINRIWVSINTKFKSLQEKEKEAFKYVKNISIKGYPQKTAEIGIYSLVINHSIYKYQFGIRMKVGEEFVSAVKTKLESFDEPFELRFNGIDLLIKIDVENIDELSDDSSKILVSETGEPRLYLSPNCFVDYIGEDFKAEILSLENRINKNANDIEDINVQLVGTGGLNMLKNSDADYSEAELKIISAIKNVGFYDVPEVIKEDDIFVRAFSAQSTVGSGAYGQQIYLANKRIYNETQNWTTASILIATLTPCDYQEHEFDVTVKSGEMKGMRIRMLVDYSVFAGTEFLYGTNINNKIVFNLDKTWYVPFGDRINTIESKVDELSKNGVYEKPMQQKNVVFLGSSNVWGDGFLFYSYLKEAVDWLYKSSGKFTAYNKAVADNPIIVSNDTKFMDGSATKITGVGSTIKFKHSGSELNICQVIERTNEYAVLGLYDGTTKVAEFTNHNDTVGNDSKTFVGDGKKVKFELDRCFTYGHSLTVDGAPKIIELKTGGYGESFPEDVDCLVIRSLASDTKKVIHTLWFKEAPAAGANIQVSYKYGETICFVKTTVGEDADGNNESAYGDGAISYDPVNPATVGSGLDFRLVNEKAFYKFWFDTDEERDITIKIERGSANPYFIFNFASSVYHNIMNAGIGGYTAKIFNNVTGYPTTNWQNIANYFTPDFITIGLTGNDDWQNFPRKISRIINMTLEELRNFPSLEIGGITYNPDDTYDVKVNAGIISEITPTSLVSESIKNSDVAVGDFARIGSYTGDLRQVQTRRVETVDKSSGKITWAEPLHINEYIGIDSISDLIGKDVSIRNIEGYVSSMEELIINLLKINPKCRICLFNVYYVDMWNRNVAEYTYIQQWIAEKFPANVFVLDAWKYSRDYCELSRHNRTIEKQANGADTIEFDSPSNLGHWEGIEVWIDDKNVYGKDCVVETGWKYTVDPNKTGAELNFAGGAYLRPYDSRGKMKLRWLKNTPVSGKNVTIKLAYYQWSGDWAHPSNGDYINNSLGRALIYAINN